MTQAQAQTQPAPEVHGWRLTLRGGSPALLGGLSGQEPGVAAASSLLPVLPEGDGPTGNGATGEGRQVLLLGSSLKGVLRHDAVRLAAAQNLGHCRGHDDQDHRGEKGEHCIVCRVFGASHFQGKLTVRSATAEVATTATVAGVTIDRRTRTVDRGHDCTGGRLWAELRSLADFSVELLPVDRLDAEEVGFVELLLAWEQKIGVRLGRRKSAGLGTFELEWTQISPQMRQGGSRAAPSRDQAPRRYLLHVEAVEPLRLADRPRRTYFRDRLDEIPASTLRGAIGWALARRGDGDLAADLFVVETGRPVQLSAGIHGVPEGRLLPARWQGLLECKPPETHRIDPTLFRIVGQLRQPAMDVSFRQQVCPVCPQDPEILLKPASPREPLAQMVVGQTEIDMGSGRVREQRLFSQALIRPGTRFTAELVAHPDQAAVITELGEVIVGGNRSRGLGRARIWVEEAPELPPVEERVARTTQAVRDERIKLGGDQVAVVGLVTDGYTDKSLPALMENHGMEVLAGNVRTVLRGSYDEQAGKTRPLRKLLAAGSWVAVRGKDITGALETLEREVVTDPLGLQPLWLRVRGELKDLEEGNDGGT